MAQLLSTSVTGNLTVTSNGSLDNLTVTSNGSLGNLTVTGNVIASGNIVSGNVYLTNNSVLVINTSVTSPDITTANQIALYSKNVANTLFFGFDTPRANNLKFFNDRFIPAHPAHRTVATLRPTSGTTNVTVIVPSGGLSMNIYANSNIYTQAANTSYKTSQRRITIGANNSSTTGNASIHANVNTAFGGNTAGNPGGGGGYLMVTKFCYETLGANVRSFVGMTNATASMVTGAGDYDPFLNTAHSIIGVGSNSSVNTLWFLCGPNGATRTATNLGISFIMSTTDLYELSLSCSPGGDSIGWRVRNLSNGAEVSGTQTTNLPSGNIFMQPCMWIKSNTAASSNMSLVNMYLETDN